MLSNGGFVKHRRNFIAKLCPFTPPLLALSCMGFPYPAKVVERDFRPAPQGRSGIDLEFLKSSRPTLMLIKNINVNFSYPKEYKEYKHINICLFYSTFHLIIFV